MEKEPMKYLSKDISTSRHLLKKFSTLIVWKKEVKVNMVDVHSIQE
jgi:hypothetical protein